MTTLPFVTSTSPAVNPVTASLKVTVNGIGLLAVGPGAAGESIVAVGAVRSEVIEKSADAVLPLPAVSWAAPAFTFTVTGPSAVGVTSKVQVVPLPWTFDAVPFVTVIPPAVNPVTASLKVAVYSYTPAWVAAVLNILPFLGILAIFGGLYGIYLLYLGLPRLMKNPEDKSAGYTVVVVVCAIVLSLVLGAVAGVVGLGMAGARVLGGSASSGAATRSTAEVQFDKNSTLGKLQELGKKMEESNKKMAAAEKSGDTNAQAAAALEGLGTLLGGGKHVDPISIDQLKPFVPDTFAGLTIAMNWTAGLKR